VRRRLLRWWWIGPLGAAVLAFGAYTAFQLEPRGNPSGQSSSDPNERCAPSPCGAPAGFEVDVTSVAQRSSYAVVTVVLRNHTRPQILEAVSYRHTSPADFVVRRSGVEYRPVFNSECASWSEVDVPRGATSTPRQLCFAIPSTGGASLVWNPDLGFISEPVTIRL
jgi:hypothetical protein